MEDSLGGGCNTIHSGGNGVSDVESIVLAGGCYLVTCELTIVRKAIHMFCASIFIGEKSSSFASDLMN